MGRTIGHAKEQEDLYLLGSSFGNGDCMPLSHFSKKFSLNKAQIWFASSSFRDIHPFFAQKFFFSLLFNKLDVNSFHWEVCQLAEHHCVLFPVSNTKSTFPFLLIHIDVRGPSRIPSLSGAMWFVSLIDDGTRGNRLYLMKNKSNVSSMFSIFHQMVSTQFIVKNKSH